MNRQLSLTGLVICFSAAGAVCFAADPIRVPVIRDTWFSAVGNEARCNLGGAPKLKLKSMQEMSVVDIDPAPLAGRAIKRATLHVHLAGSEILHRVTVGTFGAEWVEGTSASYAEQKGSSTFAARRHPDVPWAEPGSDLTSVILGQAGTEWRMADASKPDAGGWQVIPVDPVIVAARVAGKSHGFFLFDDTGTEWTRDGEKFTERMFPNRFVHSRESGPKTAPYFMIELGETLSRKGDNLSAAVPSVLAVYPKGKPLGGDIPPDLPAGGALPRLGKAEIAVIDGLDKVQPLTGVTIPQQPAEYFTRNHVWSAAQKQIRLHAAKNEFVSFQIVVRGSAADIHPSLSFTGKEPHSTIEFFRCRHVSTKSGPLPDPLVPLNGGFSVPTADDKISGQKSGTLLCEVYIPHETAAGQHAGVLSLKSAGEELKLNVALEVWDFTLPDHLSFLPEMNCYGLPDNERGYYRLAHRHRTVLNRVPYTQNGKMEPGCAPRWDGQRLNWKEWDKRFGPYFDGTAFADLPRKGVPLECFYLPLHENWPSPIEANYNGSYWADQAFRPGYREAFVEASRQIAEHFSQQSWRDTLFHFFLNGKSNYKANGWSRGSSPWLLDEPANFQDYWALRYFGEAFHDGVRQAGSGAKLIYRCDISRPEWQRDALDHVLDYNVVAGGAFLKYHKRVLERKQQFGQIVVCYGSTNDIVQSNVQPAAWSVDSWLDGVDGVLPWQTIGNDASWANADTLSLFYPGGPAGLKEPVASARLKAYTRGQQDVEYLTLLARVEKQSQQELAPRVREILPLPRSREGTGFAGGEDAGRVDYGKIRPQDLWALRVRVGKLLSAAHPAPERKLVDFRTPPRDGKARSPGYVAGTEPAPPVVIPVSKGPTVTRVIQGRPAVRDAVIDPAQPDTALGAAPRDNRLARNDTTNALLICFDMAELKLSPQSQVQSATLYFWVWDPASHGRMQVSLFGMKSEWDEALATWRRPATGKSWQGAGGAFAIGRDTGAAISSVTVEPDAGTDIADPPIEYRLDATALVRAWLADPKSNFGVAIAPVIDRAVDDGQYSRVQVLASEYREVKFTPKLEVEIK
ncbi:MAG TPA: DNRLRE domain-containing protein [Planctomycetaceae bacterium]